MRISFKSAKLQSLQRWAKIVVVNLSVFLFLLIVIEILLRSVWTVRSCIKSECDFSQIAEKSYTTLVLSTLVGPLDWNFGRDRLSYRQGFPKPAVIHTNNGIGWSAVPDPNTPGTHFNPLYHGAVS